MKTLLFVALLITATSAAYAGGSLGNLPVDTLVASPQGESAHTADRCDFNTVSMRKNNQMSICNRFGRWVPVSNLATSSEHVVSGNEKKCSISGVKITGNADIRCAG